METGSTGRVVSPERTTSLEERKPDGRAVDRAALADLRPHLLRDLERAGGVERRGDRPGQDADAVLRLLLVRLPLERARDW